MTLVLLYVVVLVVAAVVTALKGKWGVFVLGVFFGFGWVFGAVRLAKPNSWWARRFYSERKRERARRELRRRVVLARVGGTLSLALLGLAFGTLRLYRIPSSAMEPTLHCPRPGNGCTASTADRVVAVRLLGREPGRGDVVAFEIPEEGAVRCGTAGIFVNRVVGLPGERIALRRGVVSIDGERLSEPYVRPERRGPLSYPARRIPAAHYFVLGDNRTQSCDSWVWGSLPRERIVAQVVARYWPPERIGPL